MARIVEGDPGIAAARPSLSHINEKNQKRGGTLGHPTKILSRSCAFSVLEFMVFFLLNAGDPDIQGCPINIVCKILTSQLQRQVTSLVDMDQTGLIKGRSISENFVYATELIQCCHKRKAPTVVLNLTLRRPLTVLVGMAFSPSYAPEGFHPNGAVGFSSYRKLQNLQCY